MKQLNLLKILILTLSLLAHSAFAGERFDYETRVNENGVQEIWAYNKPEKAFMKLGEVEVLKKGTTLYHWANATPEQARSWNEAGHISPKVLNHLKETTGWGAAGGGFYTSLSPIDSVSYGNTLVVVTLPNQMRILRTALTNRANWASHQFELEKMGVSAITVAHTRTWLNVIDAEMLTKEIVADENYFIKNKIEKLPGLKLLNGLFTVFPHLKNEPYYQAMHQELKQIEKDVKSTNREVADAAVMKVFNHGEIQYIFDILVDMRPTYVNSEMISKLTTLMGPDDNTNGLVKSAFYAVAKHNKKLRLQVYSALLKISDVPVFVLEGVAKLDAVTASNLLNEAAAHHGKNIPTNVQERIDKMKADKTWNPVLSCDKIFAA